MARRAGKEAGRVARRAALSLALLLAASAGASGEALAQRSVTGPPAGAPAPLANATPKELEDIEILERPGAVVPKDLRFRDQSGAEVRLGDYLPGDKPLVVVLAYYECPMLCSLVLNGLLAGMKEIDLTAGKDYRALVVSFDPRDTPKSAEQKRATYVGAYGRDVGPRGWDFLVGDPASVKALSEAVGFRYRWDPKGKQFAHGAGAFVLTPDGRVSRTLYGVAFPQKNLRLSLVEAGEGKTGSTFDKFLFYCFHYDPASRGYVLASRRIMMAGGALTVLALGLWMSRVWRGERLRARRAAALPTPSGSPASPASATASKDSAASAPPTAPRGEAS